MYVGWVGWAAGGGEGRTRHASREAGLTAGSALSPILKRTNRMKALTGSDYTSYR